MSQLIQIVYVSRSTFTPMPAERGIEPSVARILAQSRINNARRGLVGALYFGDGCFFQCLEGPAEAVDGLCTALLRDPRHTDLRVLQRREIQHTSFSDWSMKYVPLDAPMRALLQRLRLARFDPYQFDDSTVAAVLEMLRSGAEVPADTPIAAVRTPATTHSPRRYMPWALGLLALVLVAAGVAWMRHA